MIRETNVEGILGTDLKFHLWIFSTSDATKNEILLPEESWENIFNISLYKEIKISCKLKLKKKPKQNRSKPNMVSSMTERPVFRNLRQEDCHEFKASLGYKVRPCFKQNKTKQYNITHCTMIQTTNKCSQLNQEQRNNFTQSNQF